MPFSFGFGKGTAALGSNKFWSPKHLSLSVWLDAQDAASVVLTSGVVSQWNDKSGNNRHATQSTAANRPTHNTSTVKSSHIVFDGANDSLNIASWGNVNQPFTRVMVFNPVAVTQYRWLMQSYPPGAGTDQGDAFYTTTGIRTLAGAHGTDVPCVQNTSYIRIAQVNGSSSNVYTNGTAIGTHNVGANVQNGLAIGWDGSSTSACSNVKFFEILIIPDILSDSDRQKLEGYLAWKWDLQSSLPANHPYKSDRP